MRRGRGGCYYCGGDGHIKRKCPDIKCFRCGKSGHLIADCPTVPGHNTGRVPPSPRPASPKKRTHPKRAFIQKYYPDLYTQALRQGCTLHSPSLIPSPTLPVEQPHQWSQVRDADAVERVADSVHRFLASQREPSVLLVNKKLEDFHRRKDQDPPLLTLPEDDTELERGDFDVIIIHGKHGYILLEVKAAGDNLDLFGRDGTEILLTVLRKAAKRLVKGRKALEHLKPRNGSRSIGMVTTLAVPNISRDDLRQALSHDETLRQTLSECIIGTSRGVQLESVCLCSDDLPPADKGFDEADGNTVRALQSWWSQLLKTNCSTRHLHPDDYEYIVEGFCQKESNRRLSEIVHCLGESFGRLRLDDKQREVAESSDQYVYLTGAPGSGKSLVLAVRAALWIREGEKIFIIYKHGTTQPASEFLRHIIDIILRPASFPKDCVIGIRDEFIVDRFIDEEIIEVLQHPDRQDLDKLNDGSKKLQRMRDSDLRGDVNYTESTDSVCNERVNFLIDEINKRTLQKLPIYDLIETLKVRFPNANIWCAGSWPSHKPDPDFVEKRLNRSYRCPPSIQRLLKALEPFCQRDKVQNVFDYVTQFTKVPRAAEEDTASRDAEWMLPANSLDPHFISHAGHGAGEIWDCRACSRNVATYLKELLAPAASADPQVEPKDVLIVVTATSLYKNTKALLHSELYTSLQGADWPVKVLNVTDKFDCNSPEILAMHVRAVGGIERKVVVFVPCRGHQQTTSGQAGGTEGSPPSLQVRNPERRAQEHPPCLQDQAQADQAQRGNQSHQQPDERQPRRAESNDSEDPHGRQVGNPERRVQEPAAHGQGQDLGLESLSSQQVRDMLASSQCLTEAQTDVLSRMGRSNLHWLWYAASRSLCHLVVLHY